MAEILLHREGVELNQAPFTVSNSPTYIWWDTDHWKMLYRRGYPWNYWKAPLSSSLTQSDDFYFHVKLKAPLNWAKASSRDNFPWAGFWRDVDATHSNLNTGPFIGRERESSYMETHHTIYSGGGGTTFRNDALWNSLIPYVYYYMVLIWDRTGGLMYIKILDENMVELWSVTTSSLLGVFTSDVAGICGVYYTTGNYQVYPEEFHEIHVNTGTTYEPPGPSGPAAGQLTIPIY